MFAHDGDRMSTNTNKKDFGYVLTQNASGITAQIGGGIET